MKKIIIKIQTVLLLLLAINVQGQLLKQGSIVVTHRTGYTPYPGNSTVLQILDANNTLGIPPTTTSSMFSSTFPNRYVWTKGLGRPNWVPGLTPYTWDYATLGAVFGITLDYIGNGNIYTANSSIYLGESQLSTNLHDKVYKIDGTSGKVSTIITLPGSDPNRGIGNLKYFTFSNHNYIVLTWWEDGQIYIYEETGSSGSGIWGYHDSFAPKFNNIPFVSDPKKAIPYGVAIRNTPSGLSVFYGEFDLTTHSPTSVGIFSIPLSTSTVTFLSPEKPEFTVKVDYLPVLNGDYSPVSDISFSTDYNKMLLAQQTLWGTNQIGAHRSRVHEYIINSSGNWIASGGIFPSGYNSGVSFPACSNCPPNTSINLSCNSAGGVTYFNNILFTDGRQPTNLKCDTSVLYTSDWIYFAKDFNYPYAILAPLDPSERSSNFSKTDPYIYGIQGLPSNNHFASDLDAFSFSLKLSEFGNSDLYDKTNLGDIEAYNPPLNCNVPCDCGSWDSISLNNQGHWWPGGSNPIPPLSYNQGAVWGVLIPHYHCSGTDCNATYTYEIIHTTNGHGTAKTLHGNSSGGLDLNQPELNNLTCGGNNTLCITPHCGSNTCPPICIPFEIICLPICACNNKVTVTFDPTSLHVVTQNNTSTVDPVSVASGTFTITSSTPVTEVRMMVDEFRLITRTGNENCRLCRNKPETWGSINTASLSGVALQTYIGPVITDDIREVVFNNGPKTVFVLSGNTLNFSIGLPGVTGLDCCDLQIEICIKIIVRDNNCCETEILQCGMFDLK